MNGQRQWVILKGHLGTYTQAGQQVMTFQIIVLVEIWRYHGKISDFKLNLAALQPKLKRGSFQVSARD